jgi:hypothetical protein
MKKIFLFVFLAVFCVLFWNAVRLIHQSATGDAGSGFSLFSDVCLPAVIGLTVGSVTTLRQKKE